MRGIDLGLKVWHVLEYDTELQVAGNHLQHAWETLDRHDELSRKAYARLFV